ncbi:MAG: hypothetical protein ACFE8J_09425 [Candidatus Heimdallarchaeota archaeon]
MSRRVLIASICMIALGSGLIPSGLLINNSINNMVANSVDEGLLGIQEEALPLVEDLVAELGIPRALRDIREVGLEETEAIVNATFFMFLINMTLHEPPVLGVVPLELLFDRWIQWVLIIPVTYSSALQNMGYPPIKGISEYHQQDLWYGNAKFVLIEGNGTLPGLVGNNTLGLGVLEYLELYDQANGNATLEQELAWGYNTTWNKLTKLTDYYRNYFVPVAIPMLVSSLDTIMPEYSGMDTKAIAEMYFFDQWANCTMFEGGIDFSTMIDDIKEPLYGFEVGRITPSNITLNSIDLLWDDYNPKSLTNDTGINEWIIARNNFTKQEELIIEFNLEEYQLRMLLDWLWVESVKWNLIPVLITLPPPLGEGMTLSEYARVIFLEVWTNGTADGRVLYPFGFPLTLKAGTVYGFEIGYQDQFNPVISTNISLSSAESLWNVSNPYSLVNKQGLQDWYDAVKNPNSAVAYVLKNANNLENTQMEMILTWLPKFRDEVMPFLAQEDRNLLTDSKTLGNTIQIGTSITGGICIGLSVIGLIGNSIKKKKLR